MGSIRPLEDATPYHGHSNTVKKHRRLATLIGMLSHLLATPFSCKRLLRPALVAWLQIERVFLDVFDDVFLLNLALEPSQGAFDRFTILNPDFGQLSCHPLSTDVTPTAMC